MSGMKRPSTRSETPLSGSGAWVARAGPAWPKLIWPELACRETGSVDWAVSAASETKQRATQRAMQRTRQTANDRMQYIEQLDRRKITKCASLCGLDL